MPPADKDKDKDKEKAKPKGSARPRKPPATPRKPPAKRNIRDAASKAADLRAAQQQETSDAANEFEDARTSASPRETNGHSQWPDYEAKTDSWDPWDEGGDDGPGEGVNRTLGEWLEAVVPPEAQLHFFNAGREFAAGIQTTLDYHLHRDGDDDGEGAGALRIDIE